MPRSSKRPSDKKRKSSDSTHEVRSGGVNASGDLTAGGDVVGRDKKIKAETYIERATFAAPAPTISPPHQLPPPPRDFTGREAELTELTAKAEGDGVTISSLHGMGGVGKTALALVLADRLKERYPDAQFYLDLKGAHEQKPLTVAEALAHVIRAYNPTAQRPEGEAELRGLYQTVLHGRRALLMMDNAADKWQVEPLMPPSSCFLLVTSRQHFTLPGLHARNLDALPPGDARDLLLKIAPRIDGHADAMAKLCGYLPLALRLAGGVLAESVILTPEEYLRRLENAKARLALFDLERVNVEAGQAWAEAGAGADDAAAQLCSDYPDAGFLVLGLRHHPRVRIRWREAALAVARRMKRRDWEGVHLGNLGSAYHSLGEYRRAIEYHEQALAIDREIGDRRGEGQDLGNLGVAYYSLKDYQRAREYCAQQRSIAADIGDRYGEGNALWGLAICFEADKDISQAIVHAQAALDIFTAIESPSAQNMRDLLAKWRGQK